MNLRNEIRFSLCFNHSSDKNSITLTTSQEDARTICDVIKEHLGLNTTGFYLTSGRKLVGENDFPQDGATYHIVPRVLGGKGGFGSMLRAIGAQIEKTTSREACRDLSGRRMRDVNNEKKLKEWVSKAADREQEQDERRKKRRERLSSEPRHNFQDSKYEDQKAQVSENQQEALLIGLQAGTSRAGLGTSGTASSTVHKRKADEPGPSGSKRACEWLGMDVNLSDLDSDSSSDEAEKPADDESGSIVGSHASSAAIITDSGNEADMVSGVHVADSGGVSDCATVSGLCKGFSDSPSDSVDSLPESSKDSLKCRPEQIDSDNRTATNGHTSSIETEEQQGAVGQSSDMTTCTSTTRETELKTETLQDCSVSEPSKAATGLLASLPAPQNENEEVNLEHYNSAAELEEVGLDRLKVALTKRGLKCGGTLNQRAERLFSVKGLTKDQTDPSLFARPSKGKRK